MSGVLLCLSTKKGYEVLRAAVALGSGRPLYVCTVKEMGVAEGYDGPIRELSAASGLPVIAWKSFRDDPITWLDARGIRSVLCIGWRYLIPNSVLEHLSGSVVIAHDSLLPKLRGFAPLPTALIIGEDRTGVTFLRAGPGVDTGDILWQGDVPIGLRDTIADLIDKVTPLYVEGARRFLLGELTEATTQDDRLATYSIWRDELDYRIDWSESADRIERTIRALGPPYLGARSLLGDQEVVIRRTEVVSDLNFAVRQPGKIWSLDSRGRPTVVCGSGLIRIEEASSGGQPLLPLKALRQRFT